MDFSQIISWADLHTSQLVRQGDVELKEIVSKVKVTYLKNVFKIFFSINLIFAHNRKLFSE